MKETETTYYCDVTGEPIDEQFDMVVVDIDRGSHMMTLPQLGQSGPQVHIGPDAHDVESEAFYDYDYTAYVDRDECVVCLEVNGGSRSFYVGDESDSNHAHLIPLVQEALDNKDD